MILNAQLTIIDLLLSKPQLLGFYEKHDLDFYCNGKETLEQLFVKRSLSKDQIDKFINLLEKAINNEVQNQHKINPVYQNIRELCFYIAENHHKYTLKAVQEIKELFLKILDINKNQSKKLSEAYLLAEKLFADIKIHLSKEETILFPLIKYLEECKRFAEKPHLGKSRPMAKTLEALKTDHTSSTKVIAETIKLLAAFSKRSTEMSLVKTIIQRLKLLQKDLQLHVHLENNILFPQAAELENYLYKKY